MPSTFKETLAFGQVAESQVEVWLRRACGYHILRVYEGGEENKGPRLQIATGKPLTLPDLFAIRGKDTRWIEVKRKSRFAWYRIGQCWTTGIDLYYYNHYINVAKLTPFPVWLLFLHDQDYSDGRKCPTGLFAGELNYLTRHEDHRSDKWGRGGMVYWKDTALKKIATVEEVKNASTAYQQTQRNLERAMADALRKPIPDPSLN